MAIVSDLSVRVLEQIREEIRSLRGDQAQLTGEVRGLREDHRELTGQMMARFEVVEGTLRDLAEQLVMLARGVKSAIEQRASTEKRFDEHERRLAELERRLGS
jgi:chromosome segregation ATPase